MWATKTRLIPFATRHINLHITAPIEGIFTESNVTMKAGPFVIPNVGYQAMFDRVVMKIVETSFEIVFIFASVFPKSPLPDGSISEAGIICFSLLSTCIEITLREIFF